MPNLCATCEQVNVRTEKIIKTIFSLAMTGKCTEIDTAQIAKTPEVARTSLNGRRKSTSEDYFLLLNVKTYAAWVIAKDKCLRSNTTHIMYWTEINWIHKWLGKKKRNVFLVIGNRSENVDIQFLSIMSGVRAAGRRCDGYVHLFPVFK